MRAGGERVTEDEMVGWRHQFIGHKFEETLGDSERQGRQPGVLQPTGSQGAGHNLVTEQQCSV